jgi:hypothetical protein
LGVPHSDHSGSDGFLAIVAKAVGQWSPRAAKGTQRTSAGFKPEIRMIRPLRQRHRRMVITLGLVLPVVLTVGIAARKPAPVVPSLPVEPATLHFGSATAVWVRSDLFAKTVIQAQLLRVNNNGSRFSLKLSAARDFVKPDLIVYWVAGNPQSVDSLPDSAMLLGAFYSASLVLPAEATVHAGVLVLYSLANNEIVEVSKSVRLDASTL